MLEALVSVLVSASLIFLVVSAGREEEEARRVKRDIERHDGFMRAAELIHTYKTREGV